MALGARCWASRFIRLLCLVMTALAVLMISILCAKGLSFCLGLMAVFAQFPRGLALLPRMVAFQAIDFQRFGMLLMSERHLSIFRIVLNHIFCKNATDRQNREQETYNDPNTDQPFFHPCFTPSP